jgi:hypothetical protein
LFVFHSCRTSDAPGRRPGRLGEGRGALSARRGKGKRRPCAPDGGRPRAGGRLGA